MEIKYEQPLSVALVFTNASTQTFCVIDEWVSNSQDRIWEFIDGYQTQFDKRTIEPGELDEYGEPRVLEKIIKADQMVQLYENQALLFRKQDPKFTYWELIDLGVFAFIFLAAGDRMNDVVDTFFEGHLTRTTTPDFERREFLV